MLLERFLLSLCRSSAWILLGIALHCLFLVLSSLIWQNVEGCGWEHNSFQVLMQTFVHSGALLWSLEIFLGRCFVTNAVFSFSILDLNASFIHCCCCAKFIFLFSDILFCFMTFLSRARSPS